MLFPLRFLVHFLPIRNAVYQLHHVLHLLWNEFIIDVVRLFIEDLSPVSGKRGAMKIETSNNSVHHAGSDIDFKHIKYSLCIYAKP